MNKEKSSRPAVGGIYPIWWRDKNWYERHKKIIWGCTMVVAVCCVWFLYATWNRDKIAKKAADDNSISIKFRDAVYRYVDDREFTDSDLREIKANLESFEEKDDRLFQRFDWKNNEEQLNSMLYMCFKLFKYVIKETNPDSKKMIWKILETTAATICKKINLPLPPHRVPWGKNWYPFSCTLTNFLVTAAFLYRRDNNNKHNNTLDTWTKTLVPAIINTPAKSLGWTRDGANMVLMAYPYLGAHILKNNFSNAIKEADFLLTLEYLNLSWTNKGSGFYRDGGFIFHGTVRALGYIFSSYPLMMILNRVIGLKDAEYRYSNVMSYVTNPSRDIKAHFPPWFGRTRDIMVTVRKYGRYAFDIICSTAMISVKTEKYTLQFNGQKSSYAFYEADRSTSNLGHYSTMARMYYYPDTETLLRDEFLAYYPGVITLDRTLKTYRVTDSEMTKAQMCQKAECIIVKLNENTIGMFNSYTINDYQFSVRELILISDYGYTVGYTVKTLQESDERTRYVSVNFGKIKTQIGDVGSSSDRTILNKKHLHFVNDSSIVHSNPINIHYNRIERAEDGQLFDSLQIEPDSNDYACFSTYHGSVQPIVEHNSSDILITDRYIIYYYNKYLYLIDKQQHNAAVGQYVDGARSILKWDAKKIKRELGGDIVLSDSCTYNRMEMSFTDVVYEMRDYTTFTNIILPNNSLLIRKVQDAEKV